MLDPHRRRCTTGLDQSPASVTTPPGAAAITASDTHDCPGGCGAQVVRTRLSCRRCWFRLPADLRQPINDAYRRDPSAHLAAVGDALHWYREHPHDAPPPPPAQGTLL